MPPHSVVLSFIGACLLWVGWFGFNAGSALSAGSLATSAFVATHFARRGSRDRMGGRRMDSQRQAQRAGSDLGLGRRPGRDHSGRGLCRPDVGSADRLDRRRVLLPMVAVVKAKLGYDDSLDAFGVHGAGGTIGALLTGVFATSCHQSDLQRRTGSRAARGHDRRQFPPDWQSGGRHLHRDRAGGRGHYFILKVVNFIMGCGCRPKTKCRAST